jgi:hypothetical protein
MSPKWKRAIYAGVALIAVAALALVLLPDAVLVDVAKLPSVHCKCLSMRTARHASTTAF